jgi:hypothetical protein
MQVQNHDFFILHHSPCAAFSMKAVNLVSELESMSDFYLRVDGSILVKREKIALFFDEIEFFIENGAISAEKTCIKITVLGCHSPGGTLLIDKYTILPKAPVKGRFLAIEGSIKLL